MSSCLLLIVPLCHAYGRLKNRIFEFSVDRGMELLSTCPWFKSEVDTRNSQEESNITATLGRWLYSILNVKSLFGQ
jgi:hypothetical protein